jgi:hypothetical protein
VSTIRENSMVKTPENRLVSYALDVKLNLFL